MVKYEFEMKDSGVAKRILGMNIIRKRSDVIFLSHQRYILKILERFGMSYTKAVSTLLTMHFKLLVTQLLETEEEKL